MHRLFDWIIRHRRLTVIALAIVTVGAALMITRARVASSLGDMLFGDMPEYHRAVEWSRSMGGDLILLVGLEHAADDENKLRDATRELAALPRVIRVVAPGTVPPLYGLDFLVSDDGHVLLELECEISDATTLERAPAFVDDVRTVLVDAGYAPEAMHFGGFVAVLASVQQETKRAIGLLTPACAVVLLLMTWLMLRRLWPVLVTLLVGVVAIIWMVGFAIAVDRDVNILIAMAPALMFLIAFADVVHICCAHERHVRDGDDSDTAVRCSATEVGRACLFTSITTMLGFGGMLLVDSPSLRRLGVVLGFGVAVALLLALVITPLALCWRPALRLERPALLSGLAGRLARIAVRAPWLTIVLFVLLTGAAIVGINRIHVETDVSRRMTIESAFRQDMIFFETHFGGSGLIELHVEWDESRDVTSLAEPARDLAATLDARADVTRTLSLLALGDRIPLSFGERDLASTLVNTSLRRARIIVQTNDTGMSSAYDLGTLATTVARERFGAGVTVEPSGALYLGGLWLNRHVASEGKAILVTFAVITIVMMLIFRSFRLGLVALLPNAFPLLMLGGVLGFVHGNVDSDLVVIALMAIGLAVDDTIHILSRCQQVAPTSSSTEEAIDRAMRDAGRGVVITSVVFALATAPLALSRYQTVRDIGMLMPLTMMAALVADILLLPALIRVGAIRLPVGGETS